MKYNFSYYICVITLGCLLLEMCTKIQLIKFYVANKCPMSLDVFMGLSTQALKTDSQDPDPRSGFNVVTCELHAARRLRALHCLTGSHALSRSTACSLDSDQGRVEAKWSLNPDPRTPIRIRCGSKVPCGEPHKLFHSVQCFYDIECGSPIHFQNKYSGHLRLSRKIKLNVW